MAAYNICVQLGVFMLHGGSRLAVVVVVVVVVVLVVIIAGKMVNGRTPKHMAKQ